MVLGMTLMVAVHWIFRRATPRNVDRVFRKGQLLSAAAYSLGHGGNDAQKTMGIITAVLASGGILTFGAGGKLPDIACGLCFRPMGPLRWEHYQEAGELFILWARRSPSSNR